MFEAPGAQAAFLRAICASASLNTTFPPPDWSLVLSKWLAPATMVWSLLEAYGEAIPVNWISTSVHNTCFFTIGGSDDSEHRTGGLRAVCQKNTQPADVNTYKA